MNKNIFAPILDKKVNAIFDNKNNLCYSLRKKLPSNISIQEKNIVEYGFKLNSKTYVKSGDIIYRPLSFIKDDLSMDMNHYGIVFGKMKNGDCLILENSDETHVNLKTLAQFSYPHSIDLIVKENKNSNFTFSEILNRAKQVEHYLYSATRFNCRHFVNYCVKGKKSSEQVEHLKKIVIPIFNIFSAFLSMVECDTKRPEYTLEVKNLNNQIRLITKNTTLLN